MAGCRVSSEQASLLVQVDGVPDCARCSRPGLMLASFPHSWKNQRNQDVEGMRASLLCSSCDAMDPAAADLLALFAVDDMVTQGNLSSFADLAGDWGEVQRQRKPAGQALAYEEDSWRRGEL
ncbi:DUF6300 family protein [Streptomyces sp. NBC_01707]|uniref:DUF6300 family protein n=1 Tax=Streptomyces sp. NBC_01707 TaxID=2975914 RepID=UPI00352FE58C